MLGSIWMFATAKPPRQNGCSATPSTASRGALGSEQETRRQAIRSPAFRCDVIMVHPRDRGSFGSLGRGAQGGPGISGPGRRSSVPRISQTAIRRVVQVLPRHVRHAVAVRVAGGGRHPAAAGRTGDRRTGLEEARPAHQPHGDPVRRRRRSRARRSAHRRRSRRRSGCPSPSPAGRGSRGRGRGPRCRASARRPSLRSGRRDQSDVRHAVEVEVGGRAHGPSPVPAGPGSSGPGLRTPVPRISHTAMRLVVSLRQRTSAMPSPSKSPALVAYQPSPPGPGISGPLGEDVRPPHEPDGDPVGRRPGSRGRRPCRRR